jgi:hypothetical protein
MLRLYRWAMKLTREQAHARLTGNVHGVLCTLHPERGPDPQPVVYAVSADGHLGVAIDSVKPKSSTRLRREINLAADPRAALLVEHWDPADWSRLWWVRAHLRHASDPPAPVIDELAEGLSQAVPQYADKPFYRVVAFRLTGLSGWSATS